ncbi:MAG TPA: hemerythrin domain-containing protein [Gammaproteobacteria bacterium]|nr:hemerythrin domain-containing protein [Gammaproteobacteria bacterium]
MPELSADSSNIRSQVASKMLEKARQAKPSDAVDLLKTEHDEAEDLYDKFFDAESSTEKQMLVAELCLALSVHMRIEEDIFYPAVNAALTGQEDEDDRKEDSLVIPEARVEHASLKRLITEVEAAPDDVECEARVQVMCEYTKHHIKEEEHKMFSKAKKCDVDVEALGQQLSRRKLELLEEMAHGAGQEQAAMPSSLFRDQSIRPDSGARL